MMDDCEICEICMFAKSRYEIASPKSPSTYTAIWIFTSLANDTIIAIGIALSVWRRRRQVDTCTSKCRALYCTIA